MKYIQAIIIVLLATSCVFGPLGTSERAIKQLNKGEYEKATSLVSKALEKDSLLPAALYSQAKIWIAYDQPELYDSAYTHVLNAQAIYDTLDTDLKRKHQKHNFDTLKFQKLKTTIDSLAFDYTRTLNTEEAYNKFLAFYATAQQKLLAKSQRNALAFAKAKAENTYQSYKNFIEKYPQAVQVPEAKKRYEKLYFDKSTADGKVTSYIRFLERNPDTPYRREAEQKIFEVVTSEHSVGGYELFIKKYPNSFLVPKARDYAYHVALQTGSTLPTYLMNDSLQYAHSLEQFGLFSILEGEDFGFIDSVGNEVIKPTYHSIDPKYTCKAYYDDFLLLEGELKGRNGARISKVNYDDVNDLGYGLLMVKLNGKLGVLHKRGDEIEKPVYDQVKLISSNILALANGNNWTLKTVSGRLIVKDQFDDIFKLGDYILFEKQDHFVVKTTAKLLAIVDNNPGVFNYQYTDYELLPDNNLWLQHADRELIADTKFNTVISSPNKIDILSNALVVHDDAGNKVFSTSYDLLGSELGRVRYNDTWVVASKGSIYWALNMKGNKQYDLKMDSVQLLGRSFMVSYDQDSVNIYFSGNKKSFTGPLKLQSLANPIVDYIVLVKGRDRLVFDKKGKQVTAVTSSNLTPLGDRFIVYEERNKKGLINVKSGDVVVKPYYQAIGNYTDDGVSLLRNKRFGFYSAKLDLIIPAEYDKNIIAYNDSTFQVEEDGETYLIDRHLKQINDSGYDQIHYWNDTLAFVRKEKVWHLFNLNSKKEVESVLPFRSYREEELSSGEHVAVILTEEGYGVLSNQLGLVVPAVYNDIVILENLSGALYFAEKNIKEAEFYVVVYYDKKGTIIRKQAFEPEEYFKIYCED